MYRTLRCLVSALVSATILSNPLAAQAGGMSQIGNFGAIPSPATAALSCQQPGPVNHLAGFHPPSIDNSIHIFKPVTITNNVNVFKPITIDKSIHVTTTIDNSKNINITKPVSITKTIDNSKTINIDKSVVINKNISDADAVAIAAAIAEASANAVASATAIATALSNSSSSSSATVNFSAASNNFSNASSNGANASLASVYVTSFAPEAPVAFAGGDIGNLSVEIAPLAQPCTIQEATVVKAIHAICISDDGHEFPASHMLGDTWINASYEGEVARCLPGARLKIVMGKVTQSSEGMAAGTSSGQVLQCAAHESLRHYKDGVLKCAPAVAVPDCTERTNLRRYGTGDMFFSYRARICLETHEEYAEQPSSDNLGRQSREHGAY